MKMPELEDEEEKHRAMNVTIPLCCNAVIPITAKVLKKHKEIKEMDDELALRREEFKTRMRKVDKRRQDIRRKEQLLMHSLKEFEDFIEDKGMKNKETKSKYVKEKEVVAELDKELLRLKKERDDLTEKKKKLEEKLAKYLPAYEFLESVVKASVQFEDVSEIITYYDTLCAINKELAKEERDELEAIDLEQENMQQYKMEMENKLLVMNNTLIDVQQEKEISEDEALAAETRYQDIREANMTRALATGQITMAISSMYMTVCNFEKSEPTQTNPSKQLEKVREFIEDWSEVVAEAKKSKEQEHGD